jgi:predicted Zn-dependent protease
MDLPSRTQWRVEIHLPRDAAEFETRSFWYNPTPLHQSYYHWMNAAVHARADLQFYYPGTHYIGHGGDAHPWPVNEDGIDLSLYRNHNFGGHKSLHVLGGTSDFSGGYWHDLGFGFGHWSEFDDMPGRKIWSWALSRSGAIWEDLLTDASGQYVEVQAGRQLSQAQLSSGIETPFTQAAFLPYAADTWREVWFPVRQIGGIVAADPDGALNVSRSGGRTRIALIALKPVQSDLIVTAGGMAVLNERLTLAPMQVYEREVSIPETEADIQVRLGNRLLWRAGAGSADAFERPVASGPEKAAGTAARDYLLGRQHELMRDYDKARGYYELCAARDPLHVPARVRLAEILFRRAEYEPALRWARSALAIDTYDPAANFVAGTILRQLGDTAAAREALGWAARSMEYRSAAYTSMAEIGLQESDWERATEYALRALDFNRYNVPALSALAVARRKLGRREDAAGVQAEILAADPLNHVARAEAWFLTSADRDRGRLTASIRSELPHEAYLELALHYARIGLKQEAARILRLSPGHPMVDYWIAYLTGSDSPEESKDRLERARRASPRLVYPFRSESIPVLKWALAQRRDWKTLYYLALVEWSLGRQAEAAGLLAECKSLPDYGPFYLARAELAARMGRPPDEDLRRALDLAPEEWRTWLALARRHSAASSYREALDVAKRGFENFPGNYMLGMEYAKALIDNNQCGAAAEVLDRLVVLPYEGASEGRVLFEKAQLLLAAGSIRSRDYGRALEHIARSKEWPEHLGAGKPYNPDERLQKYLESYCRARLARAASPATDRGALEKLKADLKRSSPWKLELLSGLSR